MLYNETVESVRKNAKGRNVVTVKIVLTIIQMRHDRWFKMIEMFSIVETVKQI